VLERARAWNPGPAPPPPPVVDPSAGTGLTPGFSEILANWDKVLQSLDKVNAYTAERANEVAANLASSCKAERDALLGTTAEGQEWQRLARRKAPSSSSRQDLPHIDFSLGVGDDTPGASAASFSAPRAKRAGAALLERWGQHLQREAARSLRAELFCSWRLAACEARKAEASSGAAEARVEAEEKLRREIHEEASAATQELQVSLTAEQDAAARLRLARSMRCKASLNCWQQVRFREVGLACFDAWRGHVIPNHASVAAKASEEASSLGMSTTEAVAVAEAAEAAAAAAMADSQTKEEQLSLLRAELERMRSELASAEQRQLSAAEDAEKQVRAAESEAAQAREDLKLAKSDVEQAASELSSAKAELATVQKTLGTVEKQGAMARQEVELLRSNGSQDAMAEARRAVSDLTIKLARAEADKSEARTETKQCRLEIEKFEAMFQHARKELELVYGVLHGVEGNHQEHLQHLKGTVRDRELALAHLHHLLERFRAPLAPVVADEELRLKDQSSPSKASLQSSASMPSFPGASPQGNAAGSRGGRSLAKEMEDRKRRWAAAWH